MDHMQKDDHHMVSKTMATLVFLFLLGFLRSNAQQTVLSVQSFEYIWERQPNGGKLWLAMPEADSIRYFIRKSFSNAIYQRWNMVFPQLELAVKPTSILTLAPPKFNTRLKDKQPGTWYLFFQAFNQESAFTDFYNLEDQLTTTLRLKCRIINGQNDSLILDRDLTVRMYCEPPPPGQVMLTKLPAYPASFANAFDSIAAWLFTPETPDIKTVRLKPACVFSVSGFNNEPLTELEFASDNKSIQLLTQPSFSFNTPGPEFTLMKNKKNIGGNTASGILSVLTNGNVNFNKEKSKVYKADYPFEAGDDTFHCIVSYTETITAEREKIKETGTDGKEYSRVESKDYSLAYRHTDSGFTDIITYGGDTLARFTLTYLSENQRSFYMQMWDGSDSATIMSLPTQWNNFREVANVFIPGNLQGTSFIMQSSRERSIKNFFVNGEIALSVYGKKLPSKALLFQQLSPTQIKIFNILSSLPYDYFE